MKEYILNFVKENKRQFVETTVLYTTTLIITIGIIYLLFPNLLNGLSEVKKVNKNIVVVSEKIDSLHNSQTYLHTKTDIIIEGQHFGTRAIMDSLRLIDKKLNDIRFSTNQNTRLIRQNTIDIQRIKKSEYQGVQPKPASKDNGVSSLEGLFKKE